MGQSANAGGPQLNMAVRSEVWDTSCKDWKDRILNGRSLLPVLPLNRKMADKAEAIFRRLRVPDIFGQPTYGEVCGPWVIEIVRTIFGAFDPETKRRALREVFLLVPKKNGKSAIAAAIMVTAQILNERPEAELLLIAPTKEIATISFKQAAGIIRLDPELAKLFHVQEHLKTIKHRITLAVLAVKAADSDVITGSKATYILIDETHVFALKKDASDIFVEIRGSLASRPDGFLFQITTQSKKPPAGVFKAELASARDVRDGKIALPMLVILYELPVELTLEGGWKDESLWALVNPNLGRSLDPDFLHDEVLKAEREGIEKLALVASQHFNVEVGLGLSAEHWAGALYWEAGVLPGLDLDGLLERCDVVTIGVDGGGLDDLFALTVLGRHKESRAWLSWGRAWAHPEVLKLRKEIAPRLEDFRKDGDLVLVERPDQEIEEATALVKKVADSGLLPEKNGIGLDTYGIAALVDALEELELGEEMIVGIGQGYKLQPAVISIPVRLKNKSFRHCGQPLMAWAVGNAKQERRGSNWIITKQASGTAKIDPLMSLLNAAILMFANPVARRKKAFQMVIVG